VRRQRSVEITEAYLALAACLATSLTACATTTPRHPGAAALATAHSPARSAHTPAGCPLGRLLPHGGAIAIDYVDFLRFGRHVYLASAEPIKARARAGVAGGGADSPAAPIAKPG